MPGQPPVLLTTNSTAPGVGAASASGKQASTASNRPSPAVAAIGYIARAPVIFADTGPVTRPAVGTPALALNTPSLLKAKTVSPYLAALESEFNDLTPTVVFGDIRAPAQAALAINELAPDLLRDAARYAFAGVGAVTADGNAPTVQTAAAEERVKYPDKGRAVLYVRSITLLKEASAELSVVQFTAAGLAPTLQRRVGWQTVALAGETVWTDVPLP